MLTLKIITPDGIFFNNPVKLVNVKTTEGYLSVLEEHVPIVGLIVPSSCHYRLENGTAKYFKIAGGILYAEPKEVRIITSDIVPMHADHEVSGRASSEKIKKLNTMV